MAHIPDLGGDRVIDDSAFQKAIIDAINSGTPIEDIARKLEYMSTTSIHRWTEGKHLPRPEYRARVLSMIAQMQTA